LRFGPARHLHGAHATTERTTQRDSVGTREIPGAAAGTLGAGHGRCEAAAIVAKGPMVLHISRNHPDGSFESGFGPRLGSRSRILCGSLDRKSTRLNS